MKRAYLILMVLLTMLLLLSPAMMGQADALVIDDHCIA
jgi:hypothetical protein